MEVFQPQFPLGLSDRSQSGRLRLTRMPSSLALLDFCEPRAVTAASDTGRPPLIIRTAHNLDFPGPQAACVHLKPICERKDEDANYLFLRGLTSFKPPKEDGPVLLSPRQGRLS